jgi:hypothetical protein
MTVFIEKEKCDHVRIKNGTGADLAQYEFAIVGPYAAVADEAIASNAVGSLHVEEGIQIQTTDLHATQNTFATVGAPVYWDNATKKFSDTLTEDYYLVGYLLVAKNSDGVIVFEKERYAKLVPASLVDIQAEVDAAELAIAAITAEAGIPFKATATLTSAAGATEVVLLADAKVGAGKKVYLHSIFASVDGATEWATATKVQVKDSADVVGAEFAVSGLTANASLTIDDATLKEPISKGAGFTAAKGLEIVADANGTGSNLIVTVFGYIA